MTADELIACLTDRPCGACKFHTDLGCSKWTCVFEERESQAEKIIKKIKQLEPLNNKDCPEWVINVIKGEQNDTLHDDNS